VARIPRCPALDAPRDAAPPLRPQRIRGLRLTGYHLEQWLLLAVELGGADLPEHSRQIAQSCAPDVPGSARVLTCKCQNATGLYSRPVPPPPDTTPEPLSPRRATAADLPAIKALIDAAYARYLTRMDKTPGPMLRDYGPSVEAGTTWVTGSPITAVLTLYPRDDHLFIENIAVHPGAQGHGLGRVLMSFAEEEAARRGLTRMALVTHEVMTENQAIYARLGYTQVERRTDDGYRRIYMEKRLPG
jgi:GNAT superfamily N-acetyltransferase